MYIYIIYPSAGVLIQDLMLTFSPEYVNGRRHRSTHYTLFRGSELTYSVWFLIPLNIKSRISMNGF